MRQVFGRIHTIIINYHGIYRYAIFVNQIDLNQHGSGLE